MAQKIVEGEVNGNKYSVVTNFYADTIHILVHKNEKIARVFRCQLYPQPGGVLSEDLVIPGIEPEALLGGSEDHIAAHLYTEVIGSLILKKNPEESRKLVLGLGNVGPRSNADITPEHRKELLFVVSLVQQSLD